MNVSDKAAMQVLPLAGLSPTYHVLRAAKPLPRLYQLSKKLQYTHGTLTKSTRLHPMLLQKEAALLEVIV
jgi:hypothetical protein